MSSTPVGARRNAAAGTSEPNPAAVLIVAASLASIDHTLSYRTTALERKSRARPLLSIGACRLNSIDEPTCRDRQTKRRCYVQRARDSDCWLLQRSGWMRVCHDGGKANYLRRQARRSCRFIRVACSSLTSPSPRPLNRRMPSTPTPPLCARDGPAGAKFGVHALVDACSHSLSAAVGALPLDRLCSVRLGLTWVPSASAARRCAFISSSPSESSVLTHSSICRLTSRSSSPALDFQPALVVG